MVYGNRDIRMGYSFGIRKLFTKNKIFLTFWRFNDIYPLDNCPPDNYPHEIPPGQLTPGIFPLTQLPLNIPPGLQPTDNQSLPKFPQYNSSQVLLPTRHLPPNNFPWKQPPGNSPLLLLGQFCPNFCPSHNYPLGNYWGVFQTE